MEKTTQKVHIIAEAGTNHNGSFTTAKKLVDVAASTGADSLKFQIIYPEGLYLEKLFKEGRYVDNEVFYKRAASQLTDDNYRELAGYCKAKEIVFSASVFDKHGIDLLEELNVTYIKLASCDLNNSLLLKMAAETGRKLIISTGMATLGEIEQAVSDIVATGNSNIVLMHCVSMYPCPTEKINLGYIKVLKQTFGFPVGLSDHSESSLAGVMSISMGAEWIEKHFTLDRQAEGFDHAYAMEPDGLAQFIRDMRASEQACRRQDVKVQSEEKEIKKFARRSIYAARDIKAGETLKEQDVRIVRPEGPLRPNDYILIVGKTTNRPIRQYEPLSLDMFD
jgi:sialic acid synthase SpsE